MMKDDKRRDLLDRTVDYFLEGKPFNMAALSQELGIARKTLYNHFSTKEELINEMVEHFFRTRRDKVEYIIDMDLPFLERGQKLISHLAEIIGTTEVFCSRREILNSDVQELYRKSYERIKEKVARFIKYGQDEDWIYSDASPAVIARLFFSLIMGSIYNGDGEEIYTSYIRVITWGLASDKTRASEIMKPLLPGSEI